MTTRQKGAEEKQKKGETGGKKWPWSPGMPLAAPTSFSCKIGVLLCQKKTEKTKSNAKNSVLERDAVSKTDDCWLSALQRLLLVKPMAGNPQEGGFAPKSSIEGIQFGHN